jgi:HAD superfamily hydrolase (TIGR01509 family)
VIFDMDGLMFDSERLAREAWRAALAERGYALDDGTYARAIGHTAQEARAVFVEAFGADLPVAAVEEDKARRLRALLEPAPPLKPGLHALLDTLDELGLPAAVASATAAAEVRHRLTAAALAERFAVVVGGDEVRAGKPAPDLFLRAADVLGVTPAVCVVLEDSEAGIRAAAAAGMVPVMVPDLVPPSDECLALCESVVGTLGGAAIVIRGLVGGTQPGGGVVSGPLRQFGSLDAYFAAAKDLTARLRSEGHEAAAAELRSGYDCLNGLTDGWALFLASIDTVRRERATALSAEERRELEKLRRVARGMVRRR